MKPNVYDRSIGHSDWLIKEGRLSPTEDIIQGVRLDTVGILHDISLVGHVPWAMSRQALG